MNRRNPLVQASFFTTNVVLHIQAVYKTFLFHAKKLSQQTVEQTVEHRAQTEQPFQENTYLLITRQFTHTNNHHSDLPRNWSCSSISQHRGNMQILSWTHDLLVTSFLLCCIPSPAALFPLLHFLARIIFLILLLLDGFIFAHIQGMLSIMTFSLAVSERWQENKKNK